jgi:ribosomal protein S5
MANEQNAKDSNFKDDNELIDKLVGINRVSKVVKG